MKTIDLRSDTVTLPTVAMRAAMTNAELGDDVYGEDPTVNQLESLAAEILGMEAGIFAPSGTQSNLLALLSHCQRGEEYIVGQIAHTYKYEAGGAAVLGSIQPQPVEFETDGTLDLDKVREKIKADDYHFAVSRLICLENTTNGQVLPLTYLQQARSLCDETGLSLHLDGARVFNAAVALQVNVSEITQHFDSVSVCLSKGLGAPVGSILCGSNRLITSARRWRKMLGGGMRQAGILAAAGIYALENNINRLADDHTRATHLAAAFKEIEGINLLYDSAKTNMVFAEFPHQHADRLCRFLAANNIIIPNETTCRLVTHLDISDADIDKVITLIKEYFDHPRKSQIDSEISDNRLPSPY